MRSFLVTTQQYSQKWQKRFDFFEQHGAPKTPEFKSALLHMPWYKRLLYNMNFISLFFGPIHFLILGMWKRCITLLACSLVIGFLFGIIEVVSGLNLDSFCSLVVGVMWSITANYAYYLHKVKGRNNWNPFEGIF